MKGFIISMDGILALLVATALITTTLWFFSNVRFEAWGENYLRSVSLDVLTLLEKNGELERAVKTNSSIEIVETLQKAPKRICMQLRIFENGEIKLIGVRPGCVYSDNFQIAKRSFTNGTNFYIAELRSWYK